MTEKRITIDFVEYASPDEMEPQDRELVEAALRARAGSYSPYSKFRVGAALRLEDGTIVPGANQENIAQGVVRVFQPGGGQGKTAFGACEASA